MQLGSVLKQIIHDKKKLVEENKEKISTEELKSKALEVDKTLDLKEIFNNRSQAKGVYKKLNNCVQNKNKKKAK